MSGRDRIEACRESELEPGERTIVQAKGDVSIGVFNVDGEYYALLNRCMHQYGPLCEGTVARGVSADLVGPGRHVRETYTEDRVITCPWHGWRYDIRTGEHVGDRSIAVPTFDTVVEDGTVYVEL